MQPVFLIALNYIREQRWALILLLSWVGISAVVVSFGRLEADDALFFVKQQAVYGVAFSAFLGTAAIHNDRRSRRILAVLSKGITRAEYLAGLVLGLLLMTGVYCLAIGICGSLMFDALGIARVRLWSLMVFILSASALIATMSVFFSTFTQPLIATALTAISLGPGIALAELGLTRNVLPVFALVTTVTAYDFRTAWEPNWGPVMWAITQVVVLWLLASWIFGRRDIAVAVE